MSADFLMISESPIQIFRFVRSTDQAVAEWASALEQYIDNIPPQERFFILLDVAGDDVSFTAEARQQSKRIFNKFRDRSGYVAMLFAWRTSPYFARLFFASLGRLRFRINYFHDLEAARQWLHEMAQAETAV